jgi:dipeptidase E
MKLFLCSHSIYPEIETDFENFLGKSLDSCSVSFVTTAANPEEEKSWMYRDIDFAKKLFKEVQLFDIEQMSLDQMVEEFTSRDILWVNGGNTSYLMKQIRETGLEKELPNILEETVYVGSSAGSMVWSKSLEIAQWYPGGSEPGASKVPGMGLLNFQIFPHYQESLFDEIVKSKPQDEEYWLLKNGQAVSYNDGVIETYGEDIKILPKEG